MNGLNLPGPGMDVLHTTIAYPCEYKLLLIVLFLDSICLLCCSCHFESYLPKMMRKDAQDARSESTERINKRVLTKGLENKNEELQCAIKVSLLHVLTNYWQLFVLIN